MRLDSIPTACIQRRLVIYIFFWRARVWLVFVYQLVEFFLCV